LTAEAWARLSALFDSAVEQPPDTLAAWLLQIDHDEPALAPRLRELLAADAARQADDWLERGPQLPLPAVHDDADAARGLVAGACVGPWRLIARLGSGGMATVWRAVRADALPARDVALKLPLAAAGASRLAERFAREQDILARLEHPYIARLYDAGVADDGTPWLAMECVHGQPIDTWCDARRLGMRERLALFAQVLDAVQYAHARLVIHRDLKPSNIFVTDSGQVRLLDFGIARLLANDANEAGQGALTLASALAMTPAYAAPEQVRGELLTTAVDVYALGVVLFRLLVGRSPYRLKVDTPAQLELAVAAAEVQRASSAVQDDAAEARGCSSATLRRALAGDLDTMLAKALALDPARRYASAAAFADDVARHLSGRPVAAQPDAALYRLRKALGRHRLQAAAGLAVLLSLALGTALALWQAGVATQQRNAAVAEAERSSAINFFYADLLEAAARSAQPVNGRDLVARAEALARREFASRPDAMAAVFLSIGLLHSGQGRLLEGRAIVEEALGVARDPAFRDDIACNLALMLDDRQRAITLLTAVAERPAGRTEGRTGDRAACLVYLGDLQRADNPAWADQHYRRALVMWEQSATRSPHDQITILGRLAFVAALQGRSTDAVRGYEHALALAGGMGREGSAMGTSLRSRLGRTWLIAGAPQRALPIFEQLLAEHHAGEPGAAPPADLLIHQAQALLDLGRSADALPPLQAAAAAARAAEHAGRQWQAHCLGRWAAARAGTPVAPAALAARAPAALDEAQTRATCALAEAQVLRAQAQWPALRAHLDSVLAQVLPEPQWAVEAWLLRAEALLQTGPPALAAADARRALTEAQRLQADGAESPRAAAAQALLARAGAV
jgi:serine/threonine protein kinase